MPELILSDTVPLMYIVVSMCFPVFEAKRTFRRISVQRAFHGGVEEKGTYRRISKKKN